MLKGFRNNGLELTDPTTGNATKYLCPGDPVTGTGWIERALKPPTDVRQMLGMGPFMLAPGDTQEVVLAIMVGHCEGSDYDNMYSLLDLRRMSKAVNNYYQSGFDVPAMPPVIIPNVAQLDGELRVYWDDVGRDYNDAGYVFEGFNIYISEFPDGRDAELVATYDLDNAITTIFDYAFNEKVGAYLYQPVQPAYNTAIHFVHYMTEDPRTGMRLPNGREYYFSVTNFAVNLDATPAVIESPREFMGPVTPRLKKVKAAADLENVTVFPNPYFGHQTREFSGQGAYVTVGNLPDEHCRITLFTLSGQAVKTIEHRNGTSFEKIELVNDNGRELASGMYVIHLNTYYGNKTLKLAIVGRR